ncbi:MAG TPA: DUF4197 domain-containing protein [Stellaceae bacterium]|nr:DUF4197 domain-containing protein [Stellaceae bacterium]
MRWIAVATVLALAAGPAAAQGNFLERGRTLLQGAAPPAAAPSTGGALSQSEASSGLREALRVAAQRTVAKVGKTDGYFKDPAIHIPLPGFLETARTSLGAIGAGGALNDLDLRMNRAAEAAAPKAYDIFADAVAKMTIADAKGIVAGPDDAATRYLKRTTSPALTKEFRPIVDRALANAGAMKAYQAASSKVASSTGGLGAMLQGGQGQGPAGFDFTGYVVGKALDGLFHYIAVEETAIRTNPAARTTALLKQVFGR